MAFRLPVVDLNTSVTHCPRVRGRNDARTSSLLQDDAGNSRDGHGIDETEPYQVVRYRLFDLSPECAERTQECMRGETVKGGARFT